MTYWIRVNLPLLESSFQDGSNHNNGPVFFRAGNDRRALMPESNHVLNSLLNASLVVNRNIAYQCPGRAELGEN